MRTIQFSRADMSGSFGNAYPENICGQRFRSQFQEDPVPQLEILRVFYSGLHTSSYVWLPSPDCPRLHQASLVGTAPSYKLQGCYLLPSALPPPEASEAIPQWLTQRDSSLLLSFSASCNTTVQCPSSPPNSSVLSSHSV